MGLHKQGLHDSRDTLLLLLSPINYQCWLITWLITALNCLCSYGATAIFTGKLWTQWKVWQSLWWMVFVLLECLSSLGMGSVLVLDCCTVHTMRLTVPQNMRQHKGNMSKKPIKSMGLSPWQIPYSFHVLQTKKCRLQLNPCSCYRLILCQCPLGL